MQCRKCNTYYEDLSYETDDPESDMGLAREHSIFNAIRRRTFSEAVKRIGCLIKCCKGDKSLLEKELCRAKELRKDFNRSQRGKITIPKKQWTWNHRVFPGGGSCYEGANTYSGKLIWFQEGVPSYAHGAASEQSFEDFLANGPSVTGVPKEIITELREVIRKAIKSSKHALDSD
ncbi:MAG: hypothetical protein ABII22_00650 [Candidatus Micrarchaeota archaeon]